MLFMIAFQTSTADYRNVMKRFGETGGRPPHYASCSLSQAVNAATASGARFPPCRSLGNGLPPPPFGRQCAFAASLGDPESRSVPDTGSG